MDNQANAGSFQTNWTYTVGAYPTSVTSGPYVVFEVPRGDLSGVVAAFKDLAQAVTELERLLRG